MISDNIKYVFSYEKSIVNIKSISEYLNNSGTHLVENININNIWYLKYSQTDIDITRTLINENIDNFVNKQINNKNTKIQKIINIFIEECLNNNIKKINEININVKLSLHFIIIIIVQIYINNLNEQYLESVILVIERFFYNKIYSFIFKNYTIQYKNYDIKLLNKINKLKKKNINNINFIKIDSNILEILNFNNYINTINSINIHNSPIDKLYIIEMLFKMICYDLKDKCKLTNVGTDILLPLLIYIIIISDIKYLYSEMNYIEEFLQPFLWNGKYGYLTTVFNSSILTIYNS